MNRRIALRTLAGAAAAWHVPVPAAAPPGKRDMIVRSARPEDYEMPLDGFSSYITPVDRFYVRSHHYTPRVDPAQYRLTVDGEVEQPLRLTLENIQKHRRAELVSVMECAGNGRALYEPPIRGVQWLYGAVGNGRWAGVRLADILRQAKPKPAAKHVLFDGADVPVGAQPDFQRSIPLEKAMHADTLLAWEMNGSALTPSHGYPLRLVVPGWAGDSWVKWVTGIRLLNEEFTGFYMATAYRHPGRPVVPGQAVPAAHMHPVTSLAVKSIIATPVDDARIPSGAVKIAGVAWSGEAPIRTVEVSVDRGRSWQRAQLGREEERYGWRLWSMSWTPQQPGHYVVMARAWDEEGRTQPLVQEWNPSGYLHNVVQQVEVRYGVAPEPAAHVTPGVSSAPAKAFQQPPGYRAACLTCHEEDIIMQQRLSRAQWDDEVDRMVKWGARLNPADRPRILDYLVRLYGPRPRS